MKVVCQQYRSDAYTYSKDTALWNIVILVVWPSRRQPDILLCSRYIL